MDCRQGIIRVCRVLEINLKRGDHHHVTFTTNPHHHTLISTNPGYPKYYRHVPSAFRAPMLGGVASQTTFTLLLNSNDLSVITAGSKLVETAERATSALTAEHTIGEMEAHDSAATCEVMNGGREEEGGDEDTSSACRRPFKRPFSGETERTAVARIAETEAWDAVARQVRIKPRLVSLFSCVATRRTVTALVPQKLPTICESVVTAEGLLHYRRNRIP